MPQLRKVLLFHTKNLIPKEGENLAQRHTQVKQDLRNLAREDILRTKSREKRLHPRQEDREVTIMEIGKKLQ